MLAAPLLLTTGRAAAHPSGPAAAVAPTATATTGTATTGAASTGSTTDPDPYLSYLRTTITGISPSIVTSSTGSSITVTGTMTNTSAGTLYDLRSVWQRSAALAGVKAIKAEIAQPSGAAAVVTEDSSVLGPAAPPPPGTATPVADKQTDLAPGATSTFVASVAVGSAGLRITARGVYALTIKVTGDIGQNGETQYERVGEVHLLGTVLSLPLPAIPTAGDTPDASGSGATSSATGTATPAPVPVNVLWPLVDTPHLGVDGVFLDDSLARTLARGGRLFGVLSALDGFTNGQAVTLVVDPQLLDEVQIMALGYRVAAAPGAPQAALTPTSVPTSTGQSGIASSNALPNTATSVPFLTTTPATAAASAVTSSSGTGALTGRTSLPGAPARVTPASPPPDTVAGTGQAAAAAFLTRLRAAANTHQVLVLPYSDPDSVAMVRAGLGDQLAALVTKGAAVAHRVLQVKSGTAGLITDTLVPAGGSVNDATLALLSGHGIAHAVLSPATVEHAGGPVGAVRIEERADNGALVTAALTDADVLPRVTDLVARGRTAGLPTRLTAVAALLTGGSLDGTGTPLIVLPDKRWTANAAGLSLLDGLLRTLGTGKVLAARPLAALTARASVSATLTYPAAAAAAELAPAYLADVVSDTRRIAAVGGSLLRARSPGAPIPADLLDPLRTALSSVTATALRSNPGHGVNILRTVGSTLDALRDQVSIVSQSPSTLAASTAPLLITVRNDLPYVVRVKVVVIDGESAGMTTTDPELEAIPEGGSHQFRIDASVVKAGRFQVHAQIRAADGSNWSAPTTITVNSSAYGALTIVLVAVAGGSLTLMVALRLVQRVRNRHGGLGKATETTAGDERSGEHRRAPEPDSILAAANEPTRRSSTPSPGTAAVGQAWPGNRAAGEASVPEQLPPRGAPFDEQGEAPR